MRQHFFAFLIFSSLTFFLFFPFFSKGLLPFPGNFLLAWFEPWRADHWRGAVTISHKPVGADALRQLYPFKKLAMEMIKESQWPLWNSYNGAGMPLLATMHPGFLNPFNIFFLFLSPEKAWSFLVILPPFLLGLFFYFYCRQVKLSLWPSLFGGLILATSGFVIVRTIYQEYLYSFLGLPLLLLLIEKILVGHRRPFWLMPVIIFFIIGSGHPQMAVYVLGASFFYGWICLKGKLRLSLFGAFLLGLGLSAVQLLPTFELWQNSALNRQTSSFIFERFLLPFSHLITLLVPNFFGNPGTYNFWGSFDYEETVLYLGSGAFLFVLSSFFFLKKNWRYWYFLFLIFISFLISFRSPVSYFLSKLSLPFLSTSIPTRIFGLATFSFAFLAAWGMEGWLKTKKFLAKTKKLIFGLSMVWLTAFLVKMPCAGPILCQQVALRNTFFGLAVFMMTLLIFSLKNFWPQRKSFLTVLILLITVLSNLYLARKFLPFSAKQTFYPENEIILALREKQKDKLFRFWSAGEARIKNNLATALKLYHPEYYEPIYLKRYGELVSFINTGEIDQYQRSDVEISDNLKSEKGLDLLSVKYLLARRNNSWQITERFSALPRAFLVGKYEMISKKEEILARLLAKEFNPKSSVVLEEDLGVKLLAGKGEVKILAEGGDFLELAVNTKTPQILVVNDNFFLGWQAEIDGEKRPILRANYTFRAVLVPAGEHQVKMVYRPKSLLAGVRISVFSLATLVFTGLFELGYKKKNEKA